MTKARVEYFVPKDIPDVVFGDPQSEGLPADHTIFAIDMVEIEPEEEVVGAIGTLDGDSMQLTDIFNRQAIVLHDPRTQVYRFITPDEGGF